MYAGTVYTYRKNLFGDIVAIYNGSTKVAEYAYDAYGKCTIVSDTNYIARKNPFRYRGYYWDSDLELYYLMSRYYDPQTGRFINADSLEYLDPETIGGLNLYAYCGNNPVMGVDPSGHLPVFAIAAIVGFLVSAATSVVTQLVTEQEVNLGVVLIDGLFGAADAALSTLGLPSGASLLLDLGMNFANSLISTAIENNGDLNREDWMSIMFSTAASTCLSAISSINKMGFDNNVVKGKMKQLDEVNDVIKKGVYRSYNDKVNKLATRTALRKEIITNKSVISNYIFGSLSTLFIGSTWKLISM